MNSTYNLSRKASYLFGALLIGLGAVATPAKASPTCGDRHAAVKNLEDSYGEKPAAMGLANNGSVVEVFTSESGTFTIIATRPDGLSCVLSAGDVWEDLPVLKAGDKI